ncbi:HupE/UreJ family protein [Microbulbifer epialgicus]|uniref:HupE/UreJ family protein n=1 Tax=Microbulbifer epialgicus TaxID=393907 RepID=A0ABV4NVA2_9GAMM
MEQYSISSSLAPGLPDQKNTANLILDYRPGKTQVFRSRGLLQNPLIITHSNLDAIKIFLREGVTHILEGIDHVLFVLCLTLGAFTLPLLLWRATGFTIGHSISLTAVFFGMIPTASWFTPLIELGIAISIIYIALLATRKSTLDSSGSKHTIFLGICMLGLLHGLGFSFVLHEILKINSPNIWQSLLAFNLEVEVGQTLIVITVWPIIHLARRWHKSTELRLRYSISAICAAIACIWTLNRGYEFVNEI